MKNDCIKGLKNISTCRQRYASMCRMLFTALFILCLPLAQIALAQTDPDLPDQALLQINTSINSLSLNNQSMSADQSERDLWIKNSLRDLNQHTPKECLNPIVPAAFELGDEYQMSYRLTGKDGCILLPDKAGFISIHIPFMRIRLLAISPSPLIAMAMNTITKAMCVAEPFDFTTAAKLL